ncbi:MAG: galactose-1-epimerase, partial [Acidimicrobiia bacterium]|nr:galactose-1-epimerase [Acidimicrobiia bacterium]
MRLDRAPFGTLSDGTPVELYSCANDTGVTVELTPFGATLVAVWAPDRDGVPGPITLGFPELAGYLQRHPYFGSTIGRYANRIAGAAFHLEGQLYRLAATDGPNHLHGGEVGLGRRLWEAEPFEDADEAGVRFRYTSPAGEDRYPGTVSVEAAYSLTSAGELVVALSATADAATPLNLTNHAYWNLAGAGDILGHELAISAEHYL